MTTLKQKSATQRNYAGLTSSQRQQQRRNRFLGAALDIFGTTGFRTATVRGVCKQAKLTDRYFYESFANLEELLMAIYEHCMQDLKSQIVTAIKTEFQISNPEKAIKAGLNAYFATLENSKIARICMIELEGVSAKVNQLYNSYINDFAITLVSLANQAYPNWTMQPKQKLILSISLIGAMRQAATSCLFNDQVIERKTLVETTSEIFIGVLNQIKKNN